MEDVYSLIERAHSGEKEARDTLVYENTGLVWSVVRRFSYSGADREELFQIGVIGLLKAIDRFDPSFQVCFSTYAVPAISGELKRFLRDDGPIKISRSIQDHQKKIREFQEEWEQKRARQKGEGGGAGHGGGTEPGGIVQGNRVVRGGDRAGPGQHETRWSPFTRRSMSPRTAVCS